MSYLYQERESAVGKAQKHLQNAREVLDWEVVEKDEELRQRRQILEERLNELEAEEDIAADQLAEAEIEFGNITCEKDRIIHNAQEQLYKLEEEIMKTAQIDDAELREKKRKYEEECNERSLQLAAERRTVVELNEKIEKLKREESVEEAEVKKLEAELEKRKIMLREHEEQCIVEEKKIQDLLAMASRDCKQKQAKREAELETERNKVMELKDNKAMTIKEYTKKMNHYKEMLAEAQSKLKSDKMKLKEVLMEEEALREKFETGVVSIARKLSEGIETKPEDLSLESLCVDFEAMSNRGRTEINQKEDDVQKELNELKSNCKIVEENVTMEEKAKDMIENDLKEMREVFRKDRTEEKMELMKFVEKFDGNVYENDR